MSGFMKRASVRPTGGGNENLDRLREALAEKLRRANTEGVTSWLGLKERLDLLVLIDIENYRELLRNVLSTKLSADSIGADEATEDRLKTAQELFEALEAFEAGLKEDDENAA